MTFDDTPFICMDENAQLGYRMDYCDITFDPEEPFVSLALIPVFPFCSDNLIEECIVYDLSTLIESVRKPGSYSILTCTCGDPQDAGIEEGVLVSHPDDNTVVWELDIAGFHPALAKQFDGKCGYIRLIFNCNEYEASIRTMLRQVQAAARSPIPISVLHNCKNYKYLVEEQPELTHIPVDGFNPSDKPIEYFLDMDINEAWPREPVFAKGTLIEIGQFGSELYYVNGQIPRVWIGRLFTRWEALAAFHRWMATVARRYTVESSFNPGVNFEVIEDDNLTELNAGSPARLDPNEFILRDGMDLESCYRAGEKFVEELAHCFSEGNTASGVIVRYIRRDGSYAQAR